MKRNSPWLARQIWDDVLFMHWPAPYESVRPYVPDPFTLDTYDGRVWISIVLFRANGNRVRGIPGTIPYSSFLELNVRTYVTFNGEPGVYFFSLDANSRAAVTGARTLFSLPYMNATMAFSEKNGWKTFHSRRIHKDYPEADLSISYRPVTDKPFLPEKGSLTEWLTERYCLWTLKGRRILKGPIFHNFWDLQEAEVHFTMDRLTDFAGPESTSEPLVHYCKTKKCLFYPFENYGKTETPFNELTNLKLEE